MRTGGRGCRKSRFTFKNDDGGFPGRGNTLFEARELSILIFTITEVNSDRHSIKLIGKTCIFAAHSS